MPSLMPFIREQKGLEKGKQHYPKLKHLKKKITAKMPIIHSPLKTKKALTQQQMGTTGTRTHTHTEYTYT